MGAHEPLEGQREGVEGALRRLEGALERLEVPQEPLEGPQEPLESLPEVLPLLRETELFGSLEQRDLMYLASRMSRRVFVRGEQLVTQAEALNEIFLINSGLVNVYRNDDRGRAVEVAQFRKGALVGELSALMNKLPNANVIAMLETEAWALSHEDFKLVLSRSIQLALSINRSLSAKLAATTRRLTPRDSAKVTAIFGSRADLPRLSFELAKSIARYTRDSVLLIDGHPLTQSPLRDEPVWGQSVQELLEELSLLQFHALPSSDTDPYGNVRLIRYTSDEQAEVDSATLLSAITGLRSFYDHIIVDLPANEQMLLADTLSFMDHIVVTSERTRLHKISQLLTRPDVAETRQRGLLVVTDWQERYRMGEVWQIEQRYKWTVGSLIDKITPQNGIDELARRIAKLRVGIAWGGGTARGWALAGIANALERLKVPMDIFAGTSAGALGAAVYGLSLDYRVADERMRAVLPYLQRTTRFFPPMGFSRHSLLAEKWWINLIKIFVGDLTFDEMLVPYAAVALDLMSGQPHVFKRGLLWQAIRGSSAVPLIAPPMVINGRAYSDGGVINAIPLDVVRDMGADILIGIDLTGCEQKINWGRKNKPNMINTLIRTINVAYNTSASRTLPLADVLIRPALRPAAVYDVSVMDEFIAEGQRATLDALPELQKAMPWLKM